MPNERPRILVIDTDQEAAKQLDELMQLCNYEVIRVHDRDSALKLAADLDFDSFMISLKIANGGFELSQEIKGINSNKDTPVSFIVDDDADYPLLMEAQFYGGLFLHKKPFDDVEILTQVGTMVRIKLLQDELKEKMVELDKLASTDPLTGLYNRRMFFKRMEEEMARATRTSSHVSLMYVDIDYFKNFNDTHGHDTGDAVLQQVTRIMSRMLRRNDVLGRIGGEEFCILLPDTDYTASKTIAERLRARVEATALHFRGNEHQVTICIGLFHTADPVGLSTDEMIRFGDEAMYRAKELGRNRVVYYGDMQD